METLKPADNIITDNQEDFNPTIKNNEVQNNKENTEMALIDELKKLITKETQKIKTCCLNKKQKQKRLHNEVFFYFPNLSPFSLPPINSTVFPTKLHFAMRLLIL